MPEDSSKAALQAFGVIPNAYFDLIARVMPGLLLLFGLNCVSSKNIVREIIDVFLPYDELRGSTTAWLLVVVSSAYILGHAMSPVVRFLEEGPLYLDVIREKVKKDKRRLRYFALPPFWSCPDATTDDRRKLQKEYNTLRCRNPSMSALAIRIRAEYTMYGGFAVAIAITLFIALIHLLQAWKGYGLVLSLRRVSPGDRLFLAVGLLAIPMMLYRHLHTWDRFRKTVFQLLDACPTPAPLSATPVAPLRQENS